MELVEHGLHYECEAVVSIGQHILRERTGSPAVLACKTDLGEVDEQVGVISFLDFGRMRVGLVRTVVEAFDRVVER